MESSQKITSELNFVHEDNEDVREVYIEFVPVVSQRLIPIQTDEKHKVKHRQYHLRTQYYSYNCKLTYCFRLSIVLNKPWYYNIQL